MLIRYVLCSLLTFVVMFGAIAPANAQSAIVGTDERLIEADVHNERAEASLKNRDFVAAAVEFTQAHDLYASASTRSDGSRDQEAYSRARQALKSAAAAYYKVEDMPVESHDTFVRVKTTYGTDLTEREVRLLDETLALLEARIGQLRIRNVPADAELRIDGVLVRHADLDKPLRLAAGQHAIEVRGEKYRTFAASAVVVPRETATLDVAMKKSDVAVRLRIEANVQVASVALDGAPPTRLPVERVVAPGPHAFVVTAEGYREHEGSFEAEPAERSVVRVTLVPRRNPLGLRFEPAFLFTSPLRGDTPFNNGVSSNEDFTEGYGLAAGARLQTFFSFLRWHALNTGLAFEYIQRPLNKGLFGPTFEWCPDALTWGDKSGAWCPVTTSILLPVVGGEARNFTGGDYAARLGMKLERRFGLLYFHFEGGLGYETYKRNAIFALGVATAYGGVGIGVDL